MDRRLREPEVGKERLLLLARELRDLGLDHRGDPADARVRPRRDLGEAEVLHHAFGPSPTAFSSRFTQWRIGFCERKVKPRTIRVVLGAEPRRAQRRLRLRAPS